jgi:hypothetical protein
MEQIKILITAGLEILINPDTISSELEPLGSTKGAFNAN